MTDNNRPRIGDPRPQVEEDPWGLMRPPSSAAEIAEHNRRMTESAGEERAAIESQKLTDSLAAIQRAKGTTADHDGLRPGDRHPSPALPDGELGDNIRDELHRWQLIEGARSRVLSRIEQEQFDRLADREKIAFQRMVTTGVAECLDAGERKQAIPALTPHLHDRLLERFSDDLWNLEHDRSVSAEIDRQCIERATEALARKYSACDDYVLETATDALELAGEARHALGAAGLTVDADLEQVVDAGVEGTVEALSKWRRAVRMWQDVQQVRAWWRAAKVRGLHITKDGTIAVVPPPRVPSGQHAQQARIDAATALAGVEAGVLQDQVCWYPPEHEEDNRDMAVTTPPTGVRGLGVSLDAHSTLRTWLTTTRLIDESVEDDERWSFGPNGLDPIEIQEEK